MDSGHAVGDALAQAQVSGGIAAAVVTVIGRPLPTISGKWHWVLYLLDKVIYQVDFNCAFLRGLKNLFS